MDTNRKQLSSLDNWYTTEVSGVVCKTKLFFHNFFQMFFTPHLDREQSDKQSIRNLVDHQDC